MGLMANKVQSIKINNQIDSVCIARTFPAGVKRLWKAFTDVEEILKWHAPIGMTNPSADVDFRVGGSYRIDMKYDDTGKIVTVRGLYKEIEEPTKLVYTWKWDGSQMETLVTVEFRKVSEDETEVILTHSGFDDVPTQTDLENNWTRESHKGGWTTAFEKLETSVESH